MLSLEQQEVELREAITDVEERIKTLEVSRAKARTEIEKIACIARHLDQGSLRLHFIGQSDEGRKNLQQLGDVELPKHQQALAELRAKHARVCEELRRTSLSESSV